MKELSKNMKEALSKCTNEWQSAYEMGVKINTLDALKNRGLIERQYNLGAMAFPRTGIEWRLIEEPNNDVQAAVDGLNQTPIE